MNKNLCEASINLNFHNSNSDFLAFCRLHMEKTTQALVYKGTIMEAITESMSQKKLFVVYISGNCPQQLAELGVTVQFHDLILL
jgi:hypothetical protein